MENPTQVNESLFSEHLLKWGITCDPVNNFYSLSGRHESYAIQRYLRTEMTGLRLNGLLPDSGFSEYWYRLFN